MIAKLRRNLRERGVRGTAERILFRLREGYSESEMVVMIKPLDAIVEPKAAGELRVEDLERRHLAGIEALNQRRGEPGATRYFENCVEHGFHGFVVLAGEDVVGYYWWVDCDNPTPHPDIWGLGRDFELEPGDVYGASFYLFEEYRGGGTAGNVLFQVESALRDRGYKRLWGAVDKDNRPARWTYQLRGYEPTWEMLNRRFVFFRWRKEVPI